jgi:hypothetical protein
MQAVLGLFMLHMVSSATSSLASCDASKSESVMTRVRRGTAPAAQQPPHLSQAGRHRCHWVYVLFFLLARSLRPARSSPPPSFYCGCQERNIEAKYGPFYSPIGLSFLPFAASCFGRLGHIAIRFPAALSHLELE